MNKFLWVSGFTLFGIQIKFYGILMASAFIIGLLIARKLCRLKGYDENLPYDLILVIFPSSIVGARLNYVLFTLHERSWSFVEILQIWNGGLMIYGGVVFAVIALAIFCWIKKINLVEIFDLVVPELILGQAIGRWGNFFNQEAYGSLITKKDLQWFPFGVYIENSHFTEEAEKQVINSFGSSVEGAWFNATFFYESLWCFIGFFLLLFLYKKINQVGTCTSVYMAYYGFERFFVEMLRTDSLYLGAIKVSVLISGILCLVGISILIYFVFKKEKKTECINGSKTLYEKENTLSSEKIKSEENDKNNDDFKQGKVKDKKVK